MTQVKAVSLISGGLDSLLAAKVVMDQGVHVEGINFYTGFCVEGHTHAIRKQDQNKQKRNNALWVAEQLGIKLHIIDIIEEYKDVVINPKHGYGANLNPCLDCKVFMVNKAREWIQENGFDFIITGEVIGQRPMSQRRDTMRIVSRDSWRAVHARHPSGASRENSGSLSDSASRRLSLPADFSDAADVLLRPLCAKIMPPTLPEIAGWVDRDKLYGFNGRGRKPQIELARRFGFEDFAQPAGGCCFLTDESYARKLADLWQARGSKIYELDDIMLLKVGRHLRPQPHYKLIIAREAGETQFLMGYRKAYTHLFPVSHGGPLTLVDCCCPHPAPIMPGSPARPPSGKCKSAPGRFVPQGEGEKGCCGFHCSETDLQLAARIVARFSQGRDADQVDVAVVEHGEQRVITVTPLRAEELPQDWYL